MGDPAQIETVMEFSRAQELVDLLRTEVSSQLVLAASAGDASRKEALYETEELANQLASMVNAEDVSQSQLGLIQETCRQVITKLQHYSKQSVQR